jgi:hypothetical protein
MANPAKTKRSVPLLAVILQLLRSCGRWFKKYWRRNWIHKIVVVLVLLVALCVGTMYGIARWYIWTQRDVPLTLGASFIPDYAEQFGLNPQQTLHAMIYDLGVRNLRFVSYWNDIEPTKGHYDFKTLDWEFAQADAGHAKVTLSIGLRQPRWPECHPPNWVNTSAPDSQWEPELEQYMQAVIERYKNNPALQSYQLENEYFLSTFGQCKNFDRGRLVNEFNFVKKLDPKHTVIIARSNNALGTPIYAPTPDEFGVSVYKRVWDSTITHRYFEYPFPAWFYAFLAGTEKIVTGKNTIIHELQAEPWPPDGQQIANTPTNELNKSLSATRLAARFQYGEATGIKTIYLWGAEDWYYMKQKRHDPDLWNVAKQQYTTARAENVQKGLPAN